MTSKSIEIGRRAAELMPGIRWSLFAAAFLVTLACPPVYADEDNGGEIEIIEGWPSCDFERLGTVKGTDGRKAQSGSSGRTRRANEDRARGRLLKQAEKLGADRVVLTKRQVQRDGGTVRYVELGGTAIGPCRETGER